MANEDGTDPTDESASDESVRQPVDVTAGNDATASGSGGGVVPPPPPKMTDYDVTDTADETSAQQEARAIKLAFDRQDVKAWLTRFEIRLEFAGVRSQWLKRLCLENVLPEDIASSCKDYFSMPKSECTGASANIYKLCKSRILEVYGPKPEEDFDKALTIVMTGLPSAAAKEIRDLICDQKVKLTNCCCAKQVSATWKKLLPAHVRAQIAGMDMKTQFDLMIKKADDTYNAIKAEAGAAAQPVALITPGKPQVTADFDTSADAPALDQMSHLADQIAAFNKSYKKAQNSSKGRGGGGRGAQQKRGGSNGSSRGLAGKPQPKQNKGNPHPDGPPDNACHIHWQYGRSAFRCAKPDQCPWANYTAPPK